MPQQPILFTKDGLDQMQAEYNDLKIKRIGAVEMLSKARDMGDRSENAAYKSARSTLSSIDRRLVSLVMILRRAKVVEPKKNGQVEIGSQVTIDGSSGKQTYTIVGSHESDYGHGNLSFFSPIGKALMGKKVGDVVTVYAPAGEIKLSILSIV